MRTICSMLAALSVAVATADATAEEFPYTGYVNAPNARLRSGPGTDHYATCRVRIGQPLEVYRRDRGGWLAVRPTDECFSWVRGSALIATDDSDVAKVTENDVIARVGSRFSQDQDISHLKLSRGEEVELLEPAEFEDQEGEDVWVKIRPPSGEFRWIAEKYLDRRPPIAEPKPGAVARRTPRGPDATRDPRDRRHPGWTSRQPIRLTAGEEESENDDQTKTSSSEEKVEDLTTLELAVAKMMSGPPSEWSFDGLRKKVDAIRRQTKNADERSKADRLLKRIDRYTGLQARFSDDAARQTAKTSVTEPKAAELPALFDFAGRLVPVVSRSRRPDAPKFALTDNKGQVVCFLEESTAIGLAQFVDKHVAVSGPKSYIERLKKDQVQVRRIVQKDPITFPAGQISRRPARGTIRQ
ncbi:MAG: SH3 domain-containing protein [Pirellulales bacterium]|nr:SH3 domain-containing protein [Pirellulales bacterium]